MTGRVNLWISKTEYTPVFKGKQKTTEMLHELRRCFARKEEYVGVRKMYNDGNFQPWDS